MATDVEPSSVPVDDGIQDTELAAALIDLDRAFRLERRMARAQRRMDAYASRTRTDTLKIAASDVAAICGLNPFKTPADLTLKYIYRGLRDLQRMDSDNLGIHLITEEEAMMQLIEKSSSVTTKLQGALSTATDGVSIASVADASNLQRKITAAVSTAVHRKEIDKEEAVKLRRQLNGQIFTDFGTRKESLAVARYIELTGHPVEGSNEEEHNTTIDIREGVSFQVIGYVDGLVNTSTAVEGDSGRVERKVVEIKNRVNRGFSIPPPFYEIVQLVTYMKLVGAHEGDLVQCVVKRSGVKRKKSDTKPPQSTLEFVQATTTTTLLPATDALNTSAPETMVSNCDQNQPLTTTECVSMMVDEPAADDFVSDTPEPLCDIDGRIHVDVTEGSCTTTTDTGDTDQTMNNAHGVDKEIVISKLEHSVAVALEDVNAMMCGAAKSESLSAHPETTSSLEDSDSFDHEAVSALMQLETRDFDSVEVAANLPGASANQRIQHEEEEEEHVGDDVDIDIHNVQLEGMHAAAWESDIVPRLKAFADMIYEIRADDTKRMHFLLYEDERDSIALSKCQFMETSGRALPDLSSHRSIREKS